MLRTKRILILLTLLLAAFWAGAQERTYADCIVKKRSEWGARCERCEAYTPDLKRDFSGTFRIELQNACSELMEVKVAVQEKNGNWRIFPVRTLVPEGSMVSYACNGTGKYMYWVRRRNDPTITFPSDHEILSEFRTR